MRQGAGPARGAVGLAVKSGWASAVLLLGPRLSPRVADSRRIDLSDPAIPESRQPYHAGFGTARRSGPELSRLLTSVGRFGRQSVTALMQHYQAAGYQLAGAGLVVGSVIDPDRIANEHIRIHALEGRLFRGVVADAVARSGLPCWIWRERDLYALAVGVLKRPDRDIRRAVEALGRGIAGSWRAEHKAAALAAWLLVAGCGPAKRTAAAGA